MDNIDELIDAIVSELSYKGEPTGKPKQFYPGASTGITNYSGYTTNRPANYYNINPQQPIESLVREQEEEEEEVDSLDKKSDKEEPDFDSTEIGKIYELKKIFSRLLSLETYLSESSDELLIKLSSYMSEAINLFKLVINNIDDFIDEVDNIIVMFYEFLSSSYQLLKKFYDIKQKEKGEN